MKMSNLGRLLKNIHNTKRLLTPFNRLINNIGPSYSSKPESEDNADVKLGIVSTKYRLYKDEDSKIIFDIYENRETETEVAEHNPLEGINLERGLNGVYEIEDLLKVLRRDNAEDIFVASVPTELQYVDYICIVSAKSTRHMKAIAEFVRKVYKKKRHSHDSVPTIEGKNSNDWMALDLGNIALHIFSKEARKRYDLDMLWSIGPEYDDECNKEDPVVELLEKHTIYLKDFKPATYN